MRTRLLVATAATLLFACGALQACGERLLDSEGGDEDAGNAGDGALADGASEGGGGDETQTPVDDRCDRAKPFGAIRDVPVAGSWSIEAARFNGDRTSAYLALCPVDASKEGCDLYTSPFSGGEFKNHTAMTTANTPFYDSYPTVTADGDFLVFSSRGHDGGALRIYFVPAVNGTFDGVVPREQRFSTSFSSMNEPYVLGTGKALYFGASQGGRWRIYVAPEWGGDAAAPAARVLTFDAGASADEMAPVVSDDELEIFFASNLHDPADTSTRLDIYRATRSEVTAAFSPGERLVALSANGNDWPVFVTPDRCDLYFINKDPVSSHATLRVTSRR